MKRCTKCKEWKDDDEFYKRKDNKGGLKSNCKECYKQSRRKYRWYHREEINQKERERDNSPLSYNSETRQKLEWYEEVKESKNGNTACRCAYDGQWFELTRRQIQHRLEAINGGETEGAENRLYCSEACKQSCSIYKKIRYERGYEPASPREVQPVLRKMRFAEDNWTCQKCSRIRVELIELGLTLHCHHKEGIHWKPLESADMDECITFCEKCHREVHSKEGCKPSDMKCPPDLKYNNK